MQNTAQAQRQWGKQGEEQVRRVKAMLAKESYANQAGGALVGAAMGQNMASVFRSAPHTHATYTKADTVTT